ncbi:unnamed protein product [Alternaria alternata]
MVRLLTIVTVLFAGDNLVNDCTRMCNKASKDSTTANQCNAGGKFSNVSSWNANFRKKCGQPYIY